jgi:FkbM family methyltransferase
MIRAIQSRLRNAVRATRHEANSLVDDVRLFARMGNGHCAFRQSRVDGMSVVVRADEDVGREIYFLREFEPQDSAFVFDNVLESDTCVDIGANVGFYTLGFAKRASRGSVHSFEPVPLNYHLLAVNVLSNGLKNVVLNPFAVGDTNRQVDLCIAKDGAYSSLIDTGRKAITESLKTEMVSLDFYCSDRNLSRVDILKVDVEGAEPMVLSGAAHLLTDPKRRPRLIMLELFEPMLRQFGWTITEIQSLMRSYGYKSFAVARGKLVQFSEQHHNRFYNVLFLDSSCSPI